MRVHLVWTQPCLFMSQGFQVKSNTLKKKIVSLVLLFSLDCTGPSTWTVDLWLKPLINERKSKDWGIYLEQIMSQVSTPVIRHYVAYQQEGVKLKKAKVRSLKLLGHLSLPPSCTGCWCIKAFRCWWALPSCMARLFQGCEASRFLLELTEPCAVPQGQALRDLSWGGKTWSANGARSSWQAVPGGSLPRQQEEGEAVFPEQMSGRFTQYRDLF